MLLLARELDLGPARLFAKDPEPRPVRYFGQDLVAVHVFAGITGEDAHVAIGGKSCVGWQARETSSHHGQTPATRSAHEKLRMILPCEMTFVGLSVVRQLFRRCQYNAIHGLNLPGKNISALRNRSSVFIPSHAPCSGATLRLPILLI